MGLEVARLHEDVDPPGGHVQQLGHLGAGEHEILEAGVRATRGRVVGGPGGRPWLARVHPPIVAIPGEKGHLASISHIPRRLGAIRLY